jgi:CO/xanthine dehydrogenase Mo-binding subunit
MNFQDRRETRGSSRRGFLKGAGALIVGFSMAGGTRRLAAQSPIDPTGLVNATQVDSWISIAADESITVYSGKIEFGQGSSTVQTQLVAEELFVPLSRITVIFGDTGFAPDQGVTSGSQSTVTEFGPGGLRQALDTPFGRQYPNSQSARHPSAYSTHADPSRGKSGPQNLVNTARAGSPEAAL